MFNNIILMHAVEVKFKSGTRIFVKTLSFSPKSIVFSEYVQVCLQQFIMMEELPA